MAALERAHGFVTKEIMAHFLVKPILGVKVCQHDIRDLQTTKLKELRMCSPYGKHQYTIYERMHRGLAGQGRCWSVVLVSPVAEVATRSTPIASLTCPEPCLAYNSEYGKNEPYRLMLQA